MLIFRRSIATALAFVLLSQAICADRVSAALPPSRLAVSSSPLFLLQDVHGNLEAQKNISATLVRLEKSSGSKLKVGVEGAAGEFDFSAYRAFPDEKLMQTIAREFLEENRIGASELTGLLEPALSFRGIESEKLYVANVEAYRSASRAQAGRKRELEAREKELAARKEIFYPADLKKLDAVVLQYRRAQIPMSVYLTALRAATSAPYFAVETFLSAHELEASLDFKRVERQRDRLARMLTDRLSARDFGVLRDEIAALKEDDGFSAQRFSMLLRAARAIGVRAETFSALDDYRRYLQLAASIHADALFRESRQMERDAYSALLARAPADAADLVRASRDLYLTEKLVRFELTPEEWEEGRDSFSDRDASLKPFEDFYRFADRRSEAMTRAVISHGLNAIVVGGFHTPEIIRGLSATGREVRIIRPKITAVEPPDGTSYLTVFAERKTPLAKLFSNWKLFLAPPATLGVARPLVETSMTDTKKEFADRFLRRVTSSLRASALNAANILTSMDATFSRQRWLIETFLYTGPLAVCLISGDRWLIGGALFVSAVLHPLAHRKILFSKRFIWSGLFTGSYLAGVNVLLYFGLSPAFSAVAALAVPAVVHLLNHYSIDHPSGWLFRFFYRFLSLPMVRMSTSETKLPPDYLALKEEYRLGLLNALAAWNAKRNIPLNQDPVTLYVQTSIKNLLDQNLATDDPKYYALALGFNEAYEQSKVGVTDFEERLFRETVQILGFFAATLPAPSRTKLSTILESTYYRYLRFSGPPESTETLSNKALSRASLEIVDAMLFKSLTEWRAKGAPYQRMSDFGSLLDTFEFFSWHIADNDQPTFWEGNLKGFCRALQKINLTPEELTGFVAFTYGLSDGPDKDSPGAQLAERGLKRWLEEGRRSRQYAAQLEKGRLKGNSMAGVETAKKLIKEWRESSPDKIDEREESGFIEFIARWTKEFETFEVSNAAGLVEFINGIVTGFVESDLTESEVSRRVKLDLFSAFQWSVRSQKNGRQTLANITGIYDSYGSRTNRNLLVRTSMAETWRGIVRNVVSQALLSEPEANAEPKLDLSPVIPALVPLVDRYGVDSAVVIQGMVDGYRQARINSAQTMILLKAEMDAAVERYRLDPALGATSLSLMLLAAKEIPGVFGAHGAAMAVDIERLLNSDKALDQALSSWGPDTDAASVQRAVDQFVVFAIDGVGGRDSESSRDAFVAMFKWKDRDPKQLAALVAADLKPMIAAWVSHPSQSSRTFDFSTLQTTIDFYLTLAQGLVPTNRVAVDEILQQVAIELEPLFQLEFQPVVEFFYEDTLVRVGKLALAIEDYELAIKAGQQIRTYIPTNTGATKRIENVYMLIGKGFMGLGKWGDALDKGLELSAAMQWRFLSENDFLPKKGVVFVGRLVDIAEALTYKDYFHSAGRYIAFARAVLQRWPTVRDAVPPVLWRRLEMIEALSRLKMDSSPENIHQWIPRVEQVLEQALADADTPISTKQYLLRCAMIANSFACHTGDRRYFERVRTSYRDFIAAGGLNVEGLVLEDQAALVRLGLAARRQGRADDAARTLSELLKALPPETLTSAPTAVDNKVDLTAFEFRINILALAGEEAAASNELDEVFKYVRAATKVPEKLKYDAHEEFHVLVLLQAALISATGSVESTLRVLTEMFDMPYRKWRDVESLACCFDFNVADKTVMLAAFDRYFRLPEKKDSKVNIASKIRAARLVLLLYPEEASQMLRSIEATETKSKPFFKALREAQASATSEDPFFWPGTERHREIFEEIEKSRPNVAELQGVKKLPPAVVDFLNKFVLNLNTIAGAYALIGMVEEAGVLVKILKDLTGGDPKSVLAIDYYSLLTFRWAGDHKTLIERGLRMLNSNETERIQKISALITRAVESLPHREWESAAKFKHFIETFKHKLVSTFNAVHFDHSTLYVTLVAGHLLGENTEKLADQAAAIVKSLDGRNGHWGELYLYHVQDVLLDRRVSLETRYKNALDLLAKARRGNEGKNPKIELLLETYRSYVTPVEPEETTDALVKIISAAEKNKQSADLFETGIPFQLAALSLDGARKPLEALKDLGRWIGGRGAATTSFAMDIVEKGHNDPDLFFSLPRHEKIPSYEWAAWRLEVAVQHGRKDLAQTELIRMLTDHNESWNENYLISVLADMLLNNQALRLGFVSAAKNVLTDFDASQWQKQPVALRRLVLLASYMGSVGILIAFDALAENGFPLKEILNGKKGEEEKGLIRILEKSLTQQDWAKRIAAMELNKPAIAKQMLERATAVFGANGTGDLAGLFEARAKEERWREQLRLAKEAREQFDFIQVRQLLDGVPVGFQKHDREELLLNAAQFERVWGVYQTGEIADAVELAAKLDLGRWADPITHRMTQMIKAQQAFDENRPQTANEILNALNGPNIPDPRLRKMKELVVYRLKVAEEGYEQVKEPAAKLVRSMDWNELEKLRAPAEHVFEIDREHRTLMRFLLGKATALCKPGGYTLAQEVLWLVVENVNLQKETEIAKELEEIRVAARAGEITEWLEPQLKFFRAKLEAERSKAARSVPHGHPNEMLNNIKFHFKGTLNAKARGRIGLVFTSLMSGPIRSGEKDKLETLPLSAFDQVEGGIGFQAEISLANVKAPKKLPLVFVGRDAQNAWLFQTDLFGSEEMEILAHGEGPAPEVQGTLVYAPDLVTASHVRALEQTMGVIGKFAADVKEGTQPSLRFNVVHRLLGLLAKPQLENSAEEIERSPLLPLLSDRIRSDAVQTAAVLNPLRNDAEATAIQGPPGTGKTTTAVETIQHLVQRGEIVICTAHAHAGVDKLAEDLLHASPPIPIVRSASEYAWKKVSSAVKRHHDHEGRLTKLMENLRRHHQDPSRNGFVYLATNNGLMGDGRCFSLLLMYMTGVPMEDIEKRYQGILQAGKPANGSRKKDAVVNEKNLLQRPAVRPIWVQEEAGQVDAAATLLVVYAVHPKAVILLGDQDQLPPHGIDGRDQQLIINEHSDSRDILTAAAYQAMSVSLFELAYAYAQRWHSVVTSFLSTSRRAHWAITQGVISVFYGGRLRHREEGVPPERRERILRDTVVFVNSRGSEGTADYGRERGEEEDPTQTSKSKVNRVEAQETIRAVSYFLNAASPKNNVQYEPKDILILTPYEAQANLINDALRMVAILNDAAAGERITDSEFNFLEKTVENFMGTRQGARVLLGELRRAPPNRRGRLVANLYERDSQIGAFRFSGAVQINRAMLPQLSVRAKNEDGADEGESLDELNQNILEARTVHKVQGQERKVVIVSMVRSQKLGFLAGKTGHQILNVALSRVQEKLVVIYSNGLRAPVIVQVEEALRKVYALVGKTFSVLTAFPKNDSSQMTFAVDPILFLFVGAFLSYVTGLPLLSSIALTVFLPTLVVLIKFHNRVKTGLDLGATPRSLNVGSVDGVTPLDRLAPPAPRSAVPSMKPSDHHERLAAA